MKESLRKMRRFLDRGETLLRITLSSEVPYGRSMVWAFVKLSAQRKWRPAGRSTLSAGPYRIRFGDIEHMWWTYREIFIDRVYLPDLPANAERIVDAGANIGLATLFYKLMFPQACIDCFEPDERNSALLRTNVVLNGLSNVRVHPFALAKEAGPLTFFSRDGIGGDSGFSTSHELRASQGHGTDSRGRSVQAVKLTDVVTGPVDILKLDIEGAEAAVLEALAGAATTIKVIQMEYHWLSDNRLGEVVNAIEACGHRYRIITNPDLRNEPGSVAMMYTVQRSGGHVGPA